MLPSCLSFLLLVCARLRSGRLGSIHLAFFTHAQLRRMHPSRIWPSFIRLILPFRAAGQHWISSHLPCSHIDFRSSLNYFGMRSITQVLDLAVFDHVSSSLHLSHTLASLSLVHIGLFCQFLVWCLFLTCFLLLLLEHTHAQRCMCVLETDREREWVHMMNNAWCGFLVSETDGGDGELPLRSFFPITYCS